MRLFALILLSLTLAACSAAEDAPAPCQAGDTAPRCLLEVAQVALVQVEAPAAYVDAAAELATAYVAVGDTDKARALVSAGLGKIQEIDSAAGGASALIALAKVAEAYGDLEQTGTLIAEGEFLASTVEADGKRIDTLAKLAAVRAKLGDDEGAAQDILELIDDRESPYASFQARALRDVAVYQAKAGKAEQSAQTLSAMTMGLVYYQAQANTDLAELAAAKNKPDDARTFLKAAEDIAASIDNGYFKAGALRDIGAVWAKLGDEDTAKDRFVGAAWAAGAAPSPQERARATSRLATVMADVGLYEDGAALIPTALQRLADEDRANMIAFSRYEIAGAAAFTGDFDTALALLEDIPAEPFSSAASLKAVTQRDIAWGMARHGQMEEAAALANAISDPRARIHALARIVRVSADPNMAALPRYL